MRRVLAAVAMTAWLFSGAPASAHHSSAMYDMTKVLTLQGVVRDFQWTNPHVWIQLVVVDDKGVTQEWSVECLSVSALLLKGWKPRSFEVGDKVTLRISPMRDGSVGGWFLGAVLANGQTLGTTGS